MNFKAAVVPAVLGILVALPPFTSAEENCPRPRLISVTGTAEINVAPDEVILSLAIESRDRDLNLAKSQNDARMKKVLSLAHNAGLEDKQIQTSALTMGPDYSEEKIPKLLGYEVTQQIVITLKDVTKYDGLMTRLLEAGINHVNGVWFQVHDPRKYREDVRLRAIHAAKEKAAAMANELGQTITKPWDISEQNDWSSTRFPANSVVNGVRDRDASQGESTVAPGQITIRASVNVSFQLE